MRPARTSRTMTLTSQAYKTDTNDQADMHRLVREINGDLGTVGGVVCCAGECLVCCPYRRDWGRGKETGR